MPITLSLLIILSFFIPTPTSAFCYEKAAESYGINASLLESIAGVESNFNPAAINNNRNGSVDMGLMQINSSWINRLGLNPDTLIYDPCYNVMTGARILDRCIARYGYTWKAVGCYNAVNDGKRAAYSWKIYRKLKAAEKNNARSALAAEGDKVTSAVGSDTSLYFRVRETSGHKAAVSKAEIE